MPIQNIIIILILCILGVCATLLLGGIDLSNTPFILENLLTLGAFVLTIFMLVKGTRCKGRLVLSPAIAFVILYLIFIYIGSIAHFLYSDDIVTLIPYVFKAHNYDLLIVSNITLLCVGIGVLLANYLFDFKPQTEIETYYSSKIEDDMPGFEISPIFFIALIVCLTCGLISAFALPQIPLIYSITNPGDVVGIMNLRNDFSSIPGIGALQFFYIRIFSLLTYFIVGIAIVKRTPYLIILSSIIVPLFLFFISMSAHRTYMLEYTFVFCIFLNFVGLRFDVKNSLIVVGVILGLFSMFTISKMGIDFSGDNGIFYLLKLTGLRFFVDQMLPLAFITENYPYQYDFLWGHTFWTDLTVFLPGVQETYSMWLSQQLNPEIEAIGSAPTCVNGELFVNFSYYGLIAGMIFLGVCMQYSFIKFVRMKKTVGNVTLLTLITYSFLSLTVAGLFFGFFLRLIPVLLAYILMRKVFYLISPDDDKD